ncbi:MAG TPA: HAD family phosphatase [Hanamia sp.]
MQKIENIIFDLGGVLLDINYHLTRVAFEDLGITNFDSMYSQANADHLFQKLETGKISEEDFYTEFNQRTGLHLTASEIKTAWNAMLLEFRENSLEYLNSLRKHYHIFLLSNTNFIHIASFNKKYNLVKREKPFDENFDKAFYSCGIGLRKPDVTCYQWVLNDLKINPETTLFIDDSAHNIEGAKHTGVQTILLKPDEKIEDLKLQIN